MKPSLEVLNIKATNGCNLRCKSCSHQSQWISPKSRIDIDRLIIDVKKLDTRVDITHHVSLLGGEVLLEPRWSELLTVIEDTFLDKCQVRFYTNGLLLDKHKETVVEHLKRGSRLRVSVHEAPHTKRGKLVMDNIKKFVEYAHDQGLSEVEDYDSAVRQQNDLWNIPNLVSYSINFLEFWSDSFNEVDGQVVPFNTNDPVGSYTYGCICENPQLYQGRLFKCAQTAYLRDTLSVFGQLDDPRWSEYLKYKGISLDCTETELNEFCETQYQPSWFCEMCPNQTIANIREQDYRFKKAKLIPVKII